MYPEKSILGKGTRAPVSTAALFTIATIWKKPECPLNEWTNMRYIHIMDYYSVIKEGNNAI